MATRLEKEVWALNRCAGCGLCVAACSKQVLHWAGAEHPVLEKRLKTVGYTKVPLDSCTFCQRFCEAVCPRLERWTPLEARVTLAARARGPVKSGAPNDVVRSLLVAGLSAGLLDGVVRLDLDPWELQPVGEVVSTVEEIAEGMGLQYLWAPALDKLNEAVFERGLKNVAVVGTPCTAQALRKLKASANPRLKPYQDALRLSVAVFCTGVYRPALIDEALVQRMGIPRHHVRRLEVSPDGAWLNAILWDGSVHTLPRQELEAYTRLGCGSCDDYLGESADLAVGSVGAPADAATLIIRTPTGDAFVRNALQMALLETSHEVDRAALAAAAGDKDRRARAQAFQEMRVLMLDALAEPLKRGEAIQQFTRLYRTPSRAAGPGRPRNGCTGC